MTRINEKREVLVEYPKIDVIVNYYWNNRGELINWNHAVEMPKTWSDVKVQISCYSFTIVGCNTNFDAVVPQLIINEDLIPGEVSDCIIKADDTGRPVLYCKIIVGNG